MKKALLSKIRESLISVAPIVIIVLLIFFTPLVSLTARELFVFLGCAVFLVLGIALFNLGADLAMTPMGEHVGSGLIRTRKLFILFSVSFVMGVLITIAEPDLSVLAGQVSAVMNSTVLIVTVGLGVGLMLLIAVLKIVFRRDLSLLLMFFYMLIFALSAMLIESGKNAFLPLAFDSGGVTTGPITVPFIMALGVGIATTVGGRDAGENSFGLIALCSAGPMIAVIALSLGSDGALSYSIPDYSIAENLFSGIVGILLETALDVAKALGLIVVLFCILQFTVLKLQRRQLFRIFVGIAYTFVGLVIFLTAVTVGFMPVGFKLGTEMADGSPAVVVVFGFIIGMVVVLAEPAVHVLNRQVESVTGGAVTRRSMMIALSVGVGVSIGLSVLRILCGFSILWYIVPGYLISLGLSIIIPKLYTAIAFDSGGVASGPLTSSFILPMAIGVCCRLRGEAAVLEFAFGVVAMVAMTPLITIQALGFKAIVSRSVRRKIEMRRIIDADDEQIICFAPLGDQ